MGFRTHACVSTRELFGCAAGGMPQGKGAQHGWTDGSIAGWCLVLGASHAACIVGRFVCHGAGWVVVTCTPAGALACPGRDAVTDGLRKEGLLGYHVVERVGGFTDGAGCSVSEDSQARA